MSGDGGIIVPLPITPTLPTVPTVPTVPVTVSVPTVPAPTQPPAPAPGPSNPPSGGTTAPPGSSPPPSSPGQAPTASNPAPACENPTTTSSSAPDQPVESSQPTVTESPESTPPTTECETPASDNTAAEGPPQAAPSTIPDPDLAVGAALASLEVLAVYAYTATRAATNAGRLNDVPPAISEYVATAETHHQVALDAWNHTLVTAGQQAITAPPLNLSGTINESLGALNDLTTIATVLLSLETTTAATYLQALGTLQSASAISLAASIHPVARQHMSVVLLLLLGQYPAPDTFATEEFAYVPDSA